MEGLLTLNIAVQEFQARLGLVTKYMRLPVLATSCDQPTIFQWWFSQKHLVAHVPIKNAQTAQEFAQSIVADFHVERTGPGVLAQLLRFGNSVAGSPRLRVALAFLVSPSMVKGWHFATFL